MRQTRNWGVVDEPLWLEAFPAFSVMFLVTSLSRGTRMFNIVFPGNRSHHVTYKSVHEKCKTTETAPFILADHLIKCKKYLWKGSWRANRPQHIGPGAVWSLPKRWSLSLRGIEQMDQKGLKWVKKGLTNVFWIKKTFFFKKKKQRKKKKGPRGTWSTSVPTALTI